MQPQRTMVDIDPALGIEGGDIDDAHLLLLLAGHAEAVEVAGITIVAGNVTRRSGSRSARLVCEVLRLDAPVHEGADAPLDRPLRTGHSIVLGSADDPEAWIFDREPATLPNPVPAAEALARAGEEGPFDLLATGPLTNVATFLRRFPDRIASVRRIVVMGGWFIGEDREAEFNTATDPLAASIVYTSGIPMTVVPLEMTLRTRLTLADIASWPVMGEAGRLFYEGTANWIEQVRRKWGSDGCCLHDPLAGAFLLYPELFQTRGIVPEVDVATGRTDVRAFDEDSPVRLVTGFDIPAFHARFLETAERVFRRLQA